MKKLVAVMTMVMVMVMAMASVSVSAADPMKGVIYDDNGDIVETEEFNDAICVIDGVEVLSSDYVRVQTVLDEAAGKGIIPKTTVEDFKPSRSISILQFFRWFLSAGIGQGDLEQEANLWCEAKIKFSMMMLEEDKVSRIEALYFVLYH